MYGILIPLTVYSILHVSTLNFIYHYFSLWNISPEMSCCFWAVFSTYNNLSDAKISKIDSMDIEFPRLS